MSLDHIYDIHLDWLSDRKGIVSSSALPSQIEVATPPDFPKGMPGIWSPEHLFVAAVSSCLMTTFLAVAENSKLEYSRFTCDATGVVDRKDGKFRVTEITLKPKLIINNAENEAKALRVLEMSEKACLISNSITSEIHFQPEILIQELV
jgi:peroxiredoxin-like protein